MKGKIPKSLSKFLNKNVIEKEVQETIAVADKRLGKALTEELGLECKQNEQIEELMRVIRFNIAGLLNRNFSIIQSIVKRITAWWPSVWLTDFQDTS